MRSLPVLAGLLCLSSPAHAIRPFITDDARVVGGRLLQLETWAQADAHTFQHFLLPAFGPNDHVELTLGAAHGANYEATPARYAMVGPLVQGKFLVRATRGRSWPGMAVAMGFLPPVGFGGFERAAWSIFIYTAFTYCPFQTERLLIHANIGISLDVSNNAATKLTVVGGIGAQLLTFAGLHIVGEIVHGDVYAGDIGYAFQAGYRYIFNDHIQVDLTGGSGLPGGSAQRSAFGSLGLRLVTKKLW